MDALFHRARIVFAFAYCDPAGLFISIIYFNVSSVGKYFGTTKFVEVNHCLLES